jgi:hypothetical protein
MLMISAGAIVAPEAGRWIHLSQARAAVAIWFLHDFLSEDFEDWWYNQQVSGRSVTDRYQAFEKDRLGVEYEHYYTGFGAVRLARNPSDSFLVSVAQPSREAKPSATPATLQIPDTRADILDLRPWKQEVAPSASFLWAVRPLSSEEAAVLAGAIALDTEFKKNNPEKAARLPKPLNEDWSADKRWLALGAERNKAALQLTELAKGLGIELKPETTIPASYRILERKLTSSEFKVPVIDVEMPTQIALWTLAALVLLTAILLQVALEQMTVDQLQTREEEWLLIDAKGGISFLLSRAWLAFLALAPVAVPLCIIGILVQRVGVGDVSAWYAATAGLAAIALATAGAYSAFRSCRRILSANSALQPTPTRAT